MSEYNIELFLKFLSILTITMCSFMKIPQIVKIVKRKDATGISLLGLLLDLSSLTTMLSYNFRKQYALLSYLEYPMILIQQYFLIFFVLLYKRYLNVVSFIGAIIYVCIAASFLLGPVPEDFINYLVPLCTPISASSKAIQLFEILRTHNSESVSILMWFISAFTNFTRIITVSMDSGDTLLLCNFTISTILSSSVVIAAYVYKQPKQKED